jgi:GNAT superfamily N-acetyltransferase
MATSQARCADRPARPGAARLPGGPAGPRPAVVTVREVAWHHLAAVALREELAAELLLRSADRIAGQPGEAPARVAYTGVAFTQDGLPVGHAALRWNDDDIELQRMYVTPPYRGSGTAAALLAAAEQAARELRVRRIVLRASDQQPGADPDWERAGYRRLRGSAPAQCFVKVIAGGREQVLS